MARPAKPTGTIETAMPLDDALTKVPTMPKPTVKVAHLRDGFDLLGSKTSVSFKESDIYELDHGLLVVSKKTKRKLVLLYGNLRGYELL